MEQPSKSNESKEPMTPVPSPHIIFIKLRDKQLSVGAMGAKGAKGSKRGCDAIVIKNLQLSLFLLSSAGDNNRRLCVEKRHTNGHRGTDGQNMRLKF